MLRSDRQSKILVAFVGLSSKADECGRPDLNCSPSRIYGPNASKNTARHESTAFSTLVFWQFEYKSFIYPIVDTCRWQKAGQAEPNQKEKACWSETALLSRSFRLSWTIGNQPWQ
jgi:hypothetical protein